MAGEEAPSRLDAISTRWTLLRQAAGVGGPFTAAARDALVLRYVPAIRRYVGAILRSEQDADDLAQDVLVRLLAGDFAGADPQRGRFRDFLKTAIRNMVRNHWSRQKRRRPASLDLSQISTDAADDEWLGHWRHSVLDAVWAALEKLEQEQPETAAHTLLRLLDDYPDESSQQLAVRLSEKIGKPIRPDATRQKLRRARLRFVDLLIAEVARGINDPTPEKIEDELGALGLMDLVEGLLPEDWKSKAAELPC